MECLKGCKWFSPWKIVRTVYCISPFYTKTSRTDANNGNFCQINLKNGHFDRWGLKGQNAQIKKNIFFRVK